MDKRHVSEQTLYVPVSEEVQAHVWAVDPGLQLFSNVEELTAQMNAPDFPNHFFFFAELTTE